MKATHGFLKVLCVTIGLAGLGLTGWCALLPSEYAAQSRAEQTAPPEEPRLADSRGEIPADAWPASWTEATRTASDLRITQFGESPMLAKRVRSGDLPPIGDRLPTDPAVIEPYEQIGEYGGTLRTFESDWNTVNSVEGLLRVGPQARRTPANLAKAVDVSADGKTATVHLREGLRWSDGHPLTADDFVFFFDHVIMNESMTPVVGLPFRGARIEKIDRLTFAYHFPQPMPLIVNYMAQGSTYVLPKHFMKQFHPAFTDAEALDRRADRMGFLDWKQMFHVAGQPLSEMDFNRPSLRAFVRVEHSPTLSVWERNPYYHKVDPRGNQLPYIDRIEMHKVGSRELAVAQAAAGQMTFAAYMLRADDIPLLKQWEDRNGYRTYLWRSLVASDVILQPNMTHGDPRLRQLFQDRRFRLALSLAIDREEINDILYYGRAVPRQTTVIPTSQYYEPSLERMNIEHDPRRARALLDEIGMIDRNGDGRREHPDGERVDITIEYHEIEAPKEAIIELVTSQWREVGVHVNFRPVAATLQQIRATGNVMDMTVWHADRSTDILFPVQPFWYVPMRIGWELGMWTRWARWHLGEGDLGEPPPAEVRQLLDWWEAMMRATDTARRIQLGRRILRSQAENLWTIPTVGLSPRPLVVHENLKNVPRRGYWGWDNRFTMPYQPPTWYLQTTDD